MVWYNIKSLSFLVVVIFSIRCINGIIYTTYLNPFISVPPDIIMNESSTDITAREGTNVSLLCKAKGYPSPNISWRREDNQPIPLGTWHGKKMLGK